VTPDLSDSTVQKLSAVFHWHKGLQKTLCDQHFIDSRDPATTIPSTCSQRPSGRLRNMVDHLAQLASFHNRCTRSMCGLTLSHCRINKVSNDNVLRERLNLHPIDKLFYNRQVLFLHRVARPTFQTLVKLRGEDQE
jgi:hypothetical protein